MSPDDWFNLAVVVPTVSVCVFSLWASLGLWLSVRRGEWDAEASGPVLVPIELRGSSPLLEHFAHLTLAPLPAPVRVSVQGYPGGSSVRVEIACFDSDTGEPRWIGGSHLVTAEELASGSERAAEDAVAAALVEAWAHEVAHALRGRGGEPVRLPHGRAVSPDGVETTEGSEAA